MTPNYANRKRGFEDWSRPSFLAEDYLARPNQDDFRYGTQEENSQLFAMGQLSLPRHVVSSETAAQFDTFAKKWLDETKYSSSVHEIILNSTYQRIIGLGRTAIPHILRRLQVAPEHWFWALQSITGEDPVRVEDAGRVNQMRVAWLEWGKQQGYRW